MEMLRNGIDFVEIERIAKSIQNPTFCNRVYGEKEREEWQARGAKAESAAAAFAAKEAFSKALGTGIRGFKLSEVEVLHDSLGAPYFVFSGAAKAIVEEKNLRVTLSITHTRTVAAAEVLTYTKGEF